MVWYSRVKSRSDRGEHHHENQTAEGGAGRSCRRGACCCGSRVSGALEKPARRSVYARHFVRRGRRCSGHAVFWDSAAGDRKFYTAVFKRCRGRCRDFFGFVLCAARTPFIDPVCFDFDRNHLQFFLGALISLMIALTGDDLKPIVHWLLGSVSMRGWGYIALFLPFLRLVLPRF